MTRCLIGCAENNIQSELEGCLKVGNKPTYTSLSLNHNERSVWLGVSPYLKSERSIKITEICEIPAKLENSFQDKDLFGR